MGRRAASAAGSVWRSPLRIKVARHSGRHALVPTLAPFSSAYLIVGMAASMRCVLVMRPVDLSCGTLKSTRMSYGGVEEEEDAMRER